MWLYNTLSSTLSTTHRRNLRRDGGERRPGGTIDTIWEAAAPWRQLVTKAVLIL